MALPTQEIERISRGTVAEQGMYRQLLLLSGALFAISLILYFGLFLGYEPYLAGQKTALDAKIAAFSKDISTTTQAELITFFSQLVNLQTLLGKHAAPSGILTWLEANTQSNTYFTKLSFNAQSYQLVLSGVSTRSQDDVADQVSIFESQPEVQRVSFGNTGPLTTGGWQFNLTVFLNPKSFLAGGKLAGQPAAAPVNTAQPSLTIPQDTTQATSSPSVMATTTKK